MSKQYLKRVYKIRNMMYMYFFISIKVSDDYSMVEK